MTAILRALRTDTNTTRVNDNEYDNIVLNQYGHIKIDSNQIKSVDIDVNSGNLSNGTQRVSIATDDVNISQMQSDIATIKTTLTSILNILNDIWDDPNNRIRVITT